MSVVRGNQYAHRAWLNGGMLPRRKSSLLAAIARGQVKRLEPNGVTATAPKDIGRSVGAGPEPVRLRLIRERAEAMRRG